MSNTNFLFQYALKVHPNATVDSIQIFINVYTVVSDIYMHVPTTNSTALIWAQNLMNAVLTVKNQSCQGSCFHRRHFATWLHNKGKKVFDRTVM